MTTVYEITTDVLGEFDAPATLDDVRAAIEQWHNADNSRTRGFTFELIDRAGELRCYWDRIDDEAQAPGDWVEITTSSYYEVLGTRIDWDAVLDAVSVYQDVQEDPELADNVDDDVIEAGRTWFGNLYRVYNTRKFITRDEGAQRALVPDYALAVRVLQDNAHFSHAQYLTHVRISEYVTIGEAAEIIAGVNDHNARMRVQRLIDRGSVFSIVLSLEADSRTPENRRVRRTDALKFTSIGQDFMEVMAGATYKNSATKEAQAAQLLKEHIAAAREWNFSSDAVLQARIDRINEIYAACVTRKINSLKREYDIHYALAKAGNVFSQTWLMDAGLTATQGGKVVF